MKEVKELSTEELFDLTTATIGPLLHIRQLEFIRDYTQARIDALKARNKK